MYLDAHHDILRDRGLRVHKDLAHLHSCNDWQKKKIKQPQLSVQGLDGHVQSLSRLISQLWLAKAEYSHLRTLIESICDVIFKYKEYLMSREVKFRRLSTVFTPRALWKRMSSYERCQQWMIQLRSVIHLCLNV